MVSGSSAGLQDGGTSDRGDFSVCNKRYRAMSRTRGTDRALNDYPDLWAMELES